LYIVSEVFKMTKKVLVVAGRIAFALVTMWFLTIGLITVLRETVAACGWSNLVEPATGVFVVPAILFGGYVVAMAIEGMDALQARKASTRKPATATK
jgi:hypothetical protein